MSHAANLPTDKYYESSSSSDEAIIDDDEARKVLDYDADNSPYPEVRAVVPTKDDPATPTNTVRMWVIGLLFTIIGSVLNQLFSLRQPSVTISAFVGQLLAYPVGVAWARVMPIGILNPDRHFNVKEHALITIMANVSFGSASATQVIEAMVKFYNLGNNPGFGILFTIATQLFGFGLAGLFQRWLVQPAAMIWPSVLSNSALLVALHSRTNALADGWTISRRKFFLIVFSIGFAWYFLPGFLFKALSYFSFICWIVPHNVVVNQLFGQVSGLGMSVLTFDWAQVVYANANPLLTPFWAGVNVIFGFVFFYWLICPIIYYTNTWYSAYLPMMSSNTFDNTGKPYNTSRIMNHDATVNVEKYENYSPMFLPAGYALTYGIAFANLTGIFVHIALYHGKEIWGIWKGKGKKDIHARINETYRQVPWWWFASITLLMWVLSIIVNEVWHTGLPVWAVLLGFLLPLVYFLPIGIIKALTNISTNEINLITEFIGGYAFLGSPIANMSFKFLGYAGVAQGLEFIADQKLGHYFHIPPRTVFFAQGIATLVGALVQSGLTIGVLEGVENVCTPKQSGGYTCPHGTVTYSSSLIWGALGPGRSYSPHQIYGNLLWFFLVGPLAVILTWTLGRKWKFFNYIAWPVVFGGMSLVPPATGINFSSWFAFNAIFNGFVKRRKGAWWSKYNYILASALDCGVAVSTVIIFLCIILPGGKLDWWGNAVYAKTADGLGTPWKKLAHGETFGPSTWH
ncbi:small oligopeptide transporter, OPT family [Talaromyces stipitatus ATCC 10500]|uniref:Small oligopeptide transporter, OPT family n=1 Tax=Talaromyces stipitatus (strain ATCC 10500 / CBS 375.48 / QM 6759 / NRRL 1006) TaxID=441959 RepID=B8M1A4_TALSN|nr:small oligopeptide transporter, OPT family [Talaromyces stipitatus ATCC 10500]EED21046.1 small oligopeptide transporter, OPT family [Talaromyces stipitatus ATCC 10500]